MEARPVPVPERIARYHPAVKAFLADKEWQYVTGREEMPVQQPLQLPSSPTRVVKFCRIHLVHFESNRI